MYITLLVLEWQAFFYTHVYETAKFYYTCIAKLVMTTQNHKNHKQKKHHGHKTTTAHSFLQFGLGLILGVLILLMISSILFAVFEKQYANRIFPGVFIADIPAAGLTKDEVVQFWLTKNEKFRNTSFTLTFENHTATFSAQTLDVGFDATVSATQAYAVGRSGNILADTYLRYQAWVRQIHLTPLFRWKEEVFTDAVINLAQNIDIPVENALFEFNGGRVTAFKPAKDGRAVNKIVLQEDFYQKLKELSQSDFVPANIAFIVPVKIITPDINNEKVNNLGIKELIGVGESTFYHSIPGRVHNVALGASRVNGVLIAPGETFSFNEAVGDISAATGYKQAYVIKNGRTVLDDGGGICQVSTTLFRAALKAGLPIVERHAHSYRVGYYEQGNWKPGFDATVYAPSYDLKIKNDTGHHILIQAKTDTANLALTFELYGTKDGREVQISPVRLWDAKPAPPPLYQDDPALPNGVVKQVDFAAPGIKAAFDYKVTRNGQELFKDIFFSNFVPWQAVYLRGTAQ